MIQEGEGVQQVSGARSLSLKHKVPIEKFWDIGKEYRTVNPRKVNLYYILKGHKSGSVVKVAFFFSFFFLLLSRIVGGNWCFMITRQFGGMEREQALESHLCSNLGSVPFL